MLTNQEQLPYNPTIQKPCTKCGEVKYFSEFYKCNRFLSGYRPDCKSCIKSQMKDYRDNNKRLVAARKRVHYLENRDAILKQKKEYGIKRKELIKKKNKRNRNNIIFSGLRYKTLERDKYKCVRCGLTQKEHLELTGFELNVDHIDNVGTNVPIEIRNNTIDNLQTLCTRCHALKTCVGRKPKRRQCSSQYPGVYWHKTKSNWRSQIKVNGKSIHLGAFSNPEDAAKAYREAFKKYYPDFGDLETGLRDFRKT